MIISKIHNGLLAILGFYISGVCLLYGYVNFVDVSPLKYTLPFEPVNRTVVAGQIIPLKIHRCNDSDDTIVYQITRGILNVTDSSTRQLSSDSKILEPGCSTSITTGSRVPSDLPDGIYRLYGSAILPGKYTKDHSVVWYSSPFTVIAPK